MQNQLGQIINILTERRERLGMSNYHIARRSGVSQPTVHRILSGKNPQASITNILAIAEAMGLTLTISALMEAGEFREAQAERKAQRIAYRTQATSALEGQGWDAKELANERTRIKQKLLAGSSKNLWAE